MGGDVESNAAKDAGGIGEIETAVAEMTTSWFGGKQPCWSCKIIGHHRGGDFWDLVVIRSAYGVVEYLAEAIATETKLKKKDCARVLDNWAAVATKAVKRVGKVTIPGPCMAKRRVTPVTKAGQA